jgi:hypothetical protein
MDDGILADMGQGFNKGFPDFSACAAGKSGPPGANCIMFLNQFIDF